MLLRRPKSEKDLRGKLRKKTAGDARSWSDETEAPTPIPALPSLPPTLALPNHLSEPLISLPPGPVDFSSTSNPWTPIPTPTATSHTRPPLSRTTLAARRAHRRSRSFSAFLADTRSSLAQSATSASTSSSSSRGAHAQPPADQPWRSREAWLALHAPRGTGKTEEDESLGSRERDRGWRGAGGGGGLFFSHLGSEGRLRERERERERERDKNKAQGEDAKCQGETERESSSALDIRHSYDGATINDDRGIKRAESAMPLGDHPRSSESSTNDHHVPTNTRMGFATMLYRQKTNRAVSTPLASIGHANQEDDSDESKDALPDSATLPMSATLPSPADVLGSNEAAPVTELVPVPTPTPPRRPLPPVPPVDEDEHEHEDEDEEDERVSTYEDEPDVSSIPDEEGRHSIEEYSSPDNSIDQYATPPLTMSKATASTASTAEVPPEEHQYPSHRSSQSSSFATLESVRPESDTLSPLSRPLALALAAHDEALRLASSDLPIIVTPTTTHTFSPPASGTEWREDASWGSHTRTSGSEYGYTRMRGAGRGLDLESARKVNQYASYDHNTPLDAKIKSIDINSTSGRGRAESNPIKRPFAFGARGTGAPPSTYKDRLDRTLSSSSSNSGDHSTSSHSQNQNQNQTRNHGRIASREWGRHSREESLPPLLPPADRWRRPHFIALPTSADAQIESFAGTMTIEQRQSLPDYDGAARDLGLGATGLGMGTGMGMGMVGRRAMSDDQHDNTHAHRMGLGLGGAGGGAGGVGLGIGMRGETGGSGVGVGGYRNPHSMSQRLPTKPVAWARASQASEDGSESLSQSHGHGHGHGHGHAYGPSHAHSNGHAPMKELRTARSVRELRGQMALDGERPIATRI